MNILKPTRHLILDDKAARAFLRTRTNQQLTHIAQACERKGWTLDCYTFANRYRARQFHALRNIAHSESYARNK